MSENESLDMEKDRDNGQITYANEVVATIVSVATTEVEGISGISGAGAISGIIGRGKIPRGVKVDMAGGNVKVDISVTVDYGIPIQKVGRNAQENVRKSIESMTGLHVEKVDLHVVGVSFEKENQELQQGQKLALSLNQEKDHADVTVEEAQEPAYPVEFDEDEQEDAEDKAAPAQEDDGETEQTQSEEGADEEPTAE